MKITVVIPVYKAESYLEAAVNSALEQPEVGEVILIEDGSPDNSLDICKKLTRDLGKVRLLQHPGGENRGVSASRNLGIRNASLEYVAFLDADDLYLPGRFSKTLPILDNNPEIDGVYEALGSFYEDENAKDLFQSTAFEELKAPNEGIPPDELFDRLMMGEAGGGFSFDGFTGRVALFEREALFFDEGMRLREDSLLMIQLSAKGRLAGGELTNPVTLRRVHQSNTITHHIADQSAAFSSLSVLFQKLFAWAKANLEVEQSALVLLRYLLHIKTMDRLENYSVKDMFYSRSLILKLLLSNLPILLNLKFWNLVRKNQLLKKYKEKKEL